MMRLMTQVLLYARGVIMHYLGVVVRQLRRTGK